MLMMLESDRYWADFCRHIERPELIDDPRFADAAARYQNRRECVGVLDEVFASRPFAEWCDEAVDARRACGRRCRRRARCTTTRRRSPTATCRPCASAEGTEFALVANPVQFDEVVTRAAARGPTTASTPRRCCSSWA